MLALTICNNGVSTPDRAVSTRETIYLVPGVINLQMYGWSSDPGMGHYPSRVGQAHTGSMARLRGF